MNFIDSYSYFSKDLKDKTIADKLIYIPNEITPYVDYNWVTQLNELTNPIQIQ